MGNIPVHLRFSEVVETTTTEAPTTTTTAAGTTTTEAPTTTTTAGGMQFGVEPGFTLVAINSGGGTDHQYTSGDSGWSHNGTPAYYTDDLDDPYSPGDGLVVTYPAGYDGGTSPITRFRESNWINSGTRRVIIDLCIKPSLNWQGHSSGVNKLLHIWLPKTNAPAGSSHNGGVILIRGSGSNILRGSYATQNGISANFNTNLSDEPVIRGEYVWIRTMFTMNTGTNADGHVDMWVNETKIMHHENVYHTGYSTKEFRYLTTSPTWGGIGDEVTEEMTLRFSRVQVLVEDA